MTVGEQIRSFVVPLDIFQSEDYSLYQRGVAADGWEAELDWSDARVSHDSLDVEKAKYAAYLAKSSAHIEQLGLVTAAALAAEAPTMGLRANLARAAADEARHSFVFAQYALMAGADVSDTSTALIPLAEELSLTHSFDHRFFVHTFEEYQALAAFSILARAYDGTFLGDLYSRVRTDEARHVAMGVHYLESVHDRSPDANGELRAIYEAVRGAAELTRQDAESYAAHGPQSADDAWSEISDGNRRFLKRVLGGEI